ncbi:MAG: GNAT family N-acetyltransferase [Minicystis sp.]
MLRSPHPNETSVLVDLAIATGLFAPGEADSLLRSVLDDLHLGKLGDGHVVQVWADPERGAPVGWVYLAIDDKANGVWNLWWIGVAPRHQGQGVGDTLLSAVEHHVRDAGGRLLLIETSSLPALERTRDFYAKRGYVACGRVPDFYADGDDKVIFAKRLSGAPANSA